LVAAGALALSTLVALGAVTTTAPARAEANATGAPLFSNNTFYAYAEAGETLNLNFTKDYDSPTAGGASMQFQATRPDGTVAWMCSVAANAAVGQSCATTGLTATQTGAWKITTTMGATGTSAFDWNITVNNGGTAQTGRVWTNAYSVLQSDGEPRDLTYYLVNDSGYQYTTTLRQYDGIGSIIRANSLGLASTADCTPTYQSRDSSNVAGLTASGCGSDYRIFFQQPSAALPASTPSADGTLAVLPTPLTAQDLAVDDLKFTPTSANSADGTFNYSITPRFQGSYELQVDTNGNGTYDDPQDRTITLGADGSGNYLYDFDGLDGQGNAIADCTLMHARIFYPQVGEIHVIQQDVEGRAGGIQITRTNGPGAPDSTIYWDDRQIDPSLHSNTTPQLNGTAGVDSTGGVHGWDFNGTSWGNAAYIDDWTYTPLNAGTGEISVGGLCLTVAKTSSATTAVEGDKVTYTVTVTSTGTGDYTAETPASFTDDLSGVLDDATYNNDAAVSYSGASTSDAPTVSGNTLSWAGPLTAGEVATITYSVTVNTPDTGDHNLHNVVTPPDTGTCDPADSCETTTPVQSFTYAKTSNVVETTEGGTVDYTITVTNTGKVDYTATEPATVTDDMFDVLDDAKYNDDATNGATLDGKTLTWSGPLAVGQTVEITYSVTVDQPDTGNKSLHNVVTSDTPGSSCDTTEGCETTTPVGSYTVTKTVDTTKAAEGDTVGYTVTVQNTGKTDYTADKPASFKDDMSGVLDDATYNKDASDGATVSGTTLSWAGPLQIGQTVKVTYSVTVNTPDKGDRKLGNVVVPTGDGGSCDPDGACTTNTPVDPPVPPAAAGGTPPGLAFTGTDLIGPGIALALLLLALGGTGLFFSRRSRQAAEPEQSA